MIGLFVAFVLAILFVGINVIGFWTINHKPESMVVNGQFNPRALEGPNTFANICGFFVVLEGLALLCAILFVVWMI
jgi:hypothetical protein